MTKKIRLIILLVCGFLFLIITPSIVLYSLGYRIDFEKRRIVATGGIYLKIWPQPAEVFIDSKLSGKTNIFFDYVFAQNLLPKQHSVLIKKEGYFSYQKTLNVKEKEVAKLEHILLFKKNMSFEFLKNSDNSPFKKQVSDSDIAQNIFLLENNTLSIFDKKTNEFQVFYSPVKAFKVSPDGQKFLYCNDYEILYSYLNSDNPEKLFINRFSEKINDCLWLNNDYIVFTINGKIKISEIDNTNEVNTIEFPSIITLSDEKQIEIKNPEIFFNQSDKKLYILTNNNLLVSEKLTP
ncbi:MAG: hypothetical protein CEN87_522 [Parcubacteria group bacterium Licking1014_1]|nr:MAG: hypothetical protein CEN87_522 [Parcubacteria group bacterium Licking1014_1]